MNPSKRPKTETSSVKLNTIEPEIIDCFSDSSDDYSNLQNISDADDSSDNNSNLQNISDANEKLYLFLLPNEVLFCIYKFLSPMDLFSLTQLKSERLTDLTYTVSEANLSSCRTANPVCISNYFTRIRRNIITKLNLNYYFYMTPADIVKLICQCKNLTSLSVVECGLRYKNIVKILKNCQKLEELAWNAEEISSYDRIFQSMKRLHLFCDIQSLSSRSVCFAMSFPNVEIVWLHFVPDTVFPFSGLWLWSSCVTRNLILTVSSLQYASVTNELVFMENIFENEPFRRNNTPVDPSISVRRCRMYNKPPYLQIRSIAEDISLLSSGPFNKYSTITIILTSEIINVSDSLIKCVKEIAGGKLRHLSLQSEAECFTSKGDALPISREEAIAVCDTLDKVFLSSIYITALNLTTVHFSAGSPIKAITQLIYLKVLSIPSCAFGNPAKVIDCQSIELSSVVSCCPKIEDFTLNCCESDSEHVTEDDVVCIKDWSQLKHLCIYFLAFRTCNFLQKVADSCVKLQSLSLISIAFGNKCMYTNNVIYLLKKAKELRLIRINEEGFYPVFERFWAAIGESINLEAICIITHSNSYVDTQTVIKAVKKLKYLHVFHLYARASDSLYNEVKKSMKEHGVKNMKVENCWSGKASYHLVSAVHYYHRQPSLCCQHLHLKDFELF